MDRGEVINEIQRFKIMGLPKPKWDWGPRMFTLRGYERALCDILCQMIRESDEDPILVIKQYGYLVEEYATDVFYHDNHRNKGDLHHQAFLTFANFTWAALQDILDVFRGKEEI